MKKLKNIIFEFWFFLSKVVGDEERRRSKHFYGVPLRTKFSIFWGFYLNRACRYYGIFCTEKHRAWRCYYTRSIAQRFLTSPFRVRSARLPVLKFLFNRVWRGLKGVASCVCFFVLHYVFIWRKNKSNCVFSFIVCFYSCKIREKRFLLCYEQPYNWNSQVSETLLVRNLIKNHRLYAQNGKIKIWFSKLKYPKKSDDLDESSLHLK